MVLDNIELALWNAVDYSPSHYKDATAKTDFHLLILSVLIFN